MIITVNKFKHYIKEHRMSLFKLMFSFLIFAASIFAQIPAVMFYQGYIQSNGTPYTGNATIVFQIYDAPTGGFLLWTSTNGITSDTVTVANGVYNYLLGSNNALTNMLWTGNGTFLQISYKLPTGNWTTNASRIQFLSVPYAFAAQRSLDSNPVGTILPFYGTETHLMSMYNNRYLMCDGKTIARSGSIASNVGEQYKDLFVLIYRVNVNDNYIAATNAWQNNVVVSLPDMRGRFLRGINFGTNRDPDAAQRKNEAGTTVGDKLGSIQEDATQEHYHQYPFGVGAAVTLTVGPRGIGADSPYNTTGVLGAKTTSETRPKNISVNYIIKY